VRPAALARSWSGSPPFTALDLTKAPMQRVFVAVDGATGQWLLLWLCHHLVWIT